MGRKKTRRRGAHPRGLALLCLASLTEGLSYVELAKRLRGEDLGDDDENEKSPKTKSWGAGTKPQDSSVQEVLHHLDVPEALFEYCESLMESLRQQWETILRQRRARPAAAPPLRSAADESDEMLSGSAELREREPPVAPLFLPQLDMTRPTRLAELLQTLAWHHQEICNINLQLSFEYGLPVDPPPPPPPRQNKGEGASRTKKEKNPKNET